MSLVLPDPFPFSIYSNFWQAPLYQQRYTEVVPMNTKKLIVIVPGSKTKGTHVPIFGALFSKFFSSYFGVQVEGDAWFEPLRTALAKTPADTIIFNWSGGISPFAIRKAARELQRILLEHTDKEIILFTKSLGGAVAEKAAQDTRLPIKRLVYIVTPHFKFTGALPPSVKVTNIFSPADNYLRFANRVLYFGFGRIELPNVQNISIPNLRHSDFNHNLEIRY